MYHKNSVAATQEVKVTFSSMLIGVRDILRNFFSVSTLFVAFKYLAFIGFSFISAVLSVNMFAHLSTVRLEQFALVGVAITLEFFKIFSIVRGTTLWKLRLRLQASRAYTMYLVLAIVSVLASYGFTLTVINRSIQVNTSSTIQLQIDNSQAVQRGYERTLLSIDESIRTNQTRLASLPPDFVTASNTLNTTIANLQATQAELQAQLAAEKANEVTLAGTALAATKAATSTSSMFKLMADGFSTIIPALTETTLMLFLLLLISILIELGIVSTAPAIPIDKNHLKHFLDEMSAHRTDELIATVNEGKKRKKVVSSEDLSIPGRIAQMIMTWKSDVKKVMNPPPAIRKVDTKPVQQTLQSTDTTTIASIPIRREHVEATKPRIRTIPEEPILTTIVTDALTSPVKVEDLKIEKEVVSTPLAPAPAPEEVAPETSTFSASIEKSTTVPVRTTPKAATRGPEEAPTSLIAPQLVAEAKVYRFGKTTEAVKDMFVAFVQKLFVNEGNPDGPLNDIANAAASSGVAPALANTFIARLLEIKGSRGSTLIEKKSDGKLYSNYPEGYIISYATAEPLRERIK